MLVVSQPTRGLDVGATEYVRSQLLARRAEGAAILLVSEDLDELLALADRLVVLYEGRIVGEMAVADANVEQLGMLMAGRGKGRVMRISIWSTPVLVVAAVLITFVITAVPILIAGANPIEAYAAFVIVPLTSPFTLLEVLVSATPHPAHRRRRGDRLPCRVLEHRRRGPAAARCGRGSRRGDRGRRPAADPGAAAS